MLDAPHLDKIEERILNSKDPSEEFDSIRGQLRAHLLDRALLGHGISTISETFSLSDELEPEAHYTNEHNVITLFFQLALERWIEDLIQTCDGGRITWHLPQDEIQITTFRYVYQQVDTNEALVR